MTSEDKVRESIFLDSLFIGDTGTYDDLGGMGQRIYTTAGQGYEKQKYIRADKVKDMLDQHAAEAVEACAKAIHKYADAELNGRDLDIAITCWWICRNAVQPK